MGMTFVDNRLIDLSFFKDLALIDLKCLLRIDVLILIKSFRVAMTLHNFLLYIILLLVYFQQSKNIPLSL